MRDWWFGVKGRGRFKVNEEKEEAMNSCSEEEDDGDALVDRRHQSVMFKSKDDCFSSFKLQEILKKRFKSFSRVKKYRALEKKIVIYICLARVYWGFWVCRRR